MTRQIQRDSEGGSGSVLVMAAIGVLVAATVLAASLGSGYQARHRAAAAADLAALAAAERLRYGSSDPCRTAREISQANGASLRDCAVRGWEVEVAVHVAATGAGGWLADPIRRARAGTDPARSGLPTNIGELGWVIPVPGPYRISARFNQAGPHWASGRHTGLDFAAPAGTAVMASAGGTVTDAGRSGAYGNLVVIDHGSVATYYAHLSAINVTVGDVMTAGQRIGAVGATGNATGAHLHLELRIGGVPHDPAAVLGGVL